MFLGQLEMFSLMVKIIGKLQILIGSEVGFEDNEIREQNEIK